MKKWLQKCAVSTGLALVATASALAPVMADDATNLFKDMDPTKNSSGIKISSSIGTVARNIITIVFIVAAIMTLFFLIMGAVNWISSGGDRGKVEEARNKITAAVIGLLILAATWALYQLVMTVAFGTGSGGITVPYLAK